MRLAGFLSFLMIMCAVPAIAAAPTAQLWQQQLQKQVDDLKNRKSPINVQGVVQVEEKDNQWIATLPTFEMAAGHQAPWTMPPIVMRTTGSSGKVMITFPEGISQKDAMQRVVTYVNPGSQNITAQWDFNKGGFQTLNANFKNFEFGDTKAGSTTSVPHLTVKTSGSTATIVGEKAENSIKVDGGGIIRSTVGSVNVNYQLADNQNLNIVRMIGLVNPLWWLTENVPFSMQTESRNLQFVDPQGQVSSLEKLATRLKIKLNPDGKTAAGNIEIEAQNAKQSPETIYGMILPKQMHLVGTTSNMPIHTLILGMSQGWDVSRGEMAAAGTRFDIDKILLETNKNTSLKGNGWLKATEGVPLGFTGRVLLNMQGLEALAATLQQEMLKPGGNAQLKTQAMILLMALQGMGKKTGAGIEFVLDMTPDGQVLLNGQNFNGLLPKSSVPAASKSSI